MEKYQSGIIIALLCLSVAAWLVPLVICCIRRLTEKPSGGPRRKSAVSRMLLFSGCLLACVWCLRYAVGYFSIISAGDADAALTWWEEIFNSVVHALQTFSMDEDYTEYILSGKEMLRGIFGAGSPWETLYGLYASVLNFIAPIAGGAIIFEILASIFPKIRLRLSHLAFWREKYYFSELNDASLALAKSVCSLPVSSLKRPVIVFTDAYVDDENEKSAEMLLEAKLLGAICIKSDLSHVRKNKLGARKFFLIDRAESGNLRTLADLANTDSSRYLKKAEIYFFTNDDAYIRLEKSVRDRLENDLGFGEDELPVFVPIRSCRNLISNLLVDVPLYEPLVGKPRDAEGDQTLTVTILGTGHIGTEMFLTTYWMGQILHCKLKVNVISRESREEFWGRIDYVNPEIRHTTVKGDPILRVNRRGDMAEVYCEVNYHSCDVRSSEFVSCLLDPEKQILNTDYFLVSLGSDEDNISAANTVKRYIGQHHIHTIDPLKTVIAYVVCDARLSETLNRKRFYNFAGEKPDVYMQAIGSVNDVYSVRNVFLTDHEPLAQKTREAYAAVQDREGRAKTHRDRAKDDYKHWANLARAMHRKYKVYSMGMIHDSLFDHPGDQAMYYEKLADAYEEFKAVVSGQFELSSPEQAAAHLALLHKMAWLEHRRWSAFTRVKGFRGTADYDVYAVSGDMSSYKQMDLKLHPCLVECDQKGIRANISAKGVIDVQSLFRCPDRDDFDLLDDLSYDLYSKNYNNYDFKQYDYPIFDL